MYLIHRSRVRIMIGNIFLAKADAIAAYEMEPNNSDLVPVLGRFLDFNFECSLLIGSGHIQSETFHSSFISTRFNSNC